MIAGGIGIGPAIGTRQLRPAPRYGKYTPRLLWPNRPTSSNPSSAPTLEAATLAAGIAGFTAGAGAMWRPRWTALLFAILVAANLAFVSGAMTAGEQDGRAIGLAVVAPLVAAGITWWWGEYRG